MSAFLLFADALTPAVPLVDVHPPALLETLWAVLSAGAAAVAAAVTYFIASRAKGSKAWDVIGIVTEAAQNTIAHVAQVEKPDLERYLADGKLDAAERADLLAKAWATLKTDMGAKGYATLEKALAAVVPEGAETFLKGTLARLWDAFIAKKLSAPVPVATEAPATGTRYVAQTLPSGETVAVKVTTNPSTPHGAR